MAQNTPVAAVGDARFIGLSVFNDPQYGQFASKRHHAGDAVSALVPGNARRFRLVRALCDRKAVALKELLESFEVWARCRRKVRAPVMADLCCGHGLTGVLFATLEPKVQKVVLVDRSRPDSFEQVLAAAVEVDPTVAQRIEYRERQIERVGDDLPAGTAVLGVHACGSRTDRCIDAALVTGGPVALLPCCYAQPPASAPKALRLSLGIELANDIDRTYRLQRAGYTVTWSAIPRAITPMNRLMVGRPQTSPTPPQGR